MQLQSDDSQELLSCASENVSDKRVMTLPSNHEGQVTVIECLAIILE